MKFATVVPDAANSAPATPSRRGLRDALREETGAALIELAFIMAFLGLPLFMGTVHFGWLAMDSIIVANAAHAGAEYGMTSSTFAQDAATVTTAAQDDAFGLGSSLTVTPTVFYVCSTAIGGTQYTTQAAANTACSSSHALQFIQVIASVAVTPPCSFPGVPNTVTLTSTSIMEVEE
jgi:Flp pilus assembly protein TadG